MSPRLRLWSLTQRAAGEGYAPDHGPVPQWGKRPETATQRATREREERLDQIQAERAAALKRLLAEGGIA